MDRSEDDPSTSDRRIGLVWVIALVGLVIGGWLAASRLGGASAGIVVEKTTEYVACHQSGSRYDSVQNCKERRCPRIDYLTGDGRRKGVCVSQQRFDSLRVGDRFEE
ncbi:hypothetical protein [Micromonospora sonneratiae]|uniref:Uncharacterized protein n=1 Tax=Micromonospora sonneratiae TaxID=1184706 RepID=A0ABW3YDE5_9ACTN